MQNNRLPNPSACSRLLRGVLLMVSLLVAGLASAAPMTIAEVTLVAGSVLRYPQEGKAQPLRSADKIQEGDRIVTGAGAVVHLRFVDGAHVGLRESSELKIMAYRADPVAISLDLGKGTLRHISGEYAKKSSESFRLNTPIAAIGVRGTDFIAGLRDQKTFALLLDGAIYLSPGACPAECPRTLVATPQTLATIDVRGQVETRQVEPSEIRNLVGRQRLAQAATDASALARNANSEKNRPLVGNVPEAPVEVANVRPELVWTRWLASGRLDESFSRDDAEFTAKADYQAKVSNLYYTLWRREEASSWSPGSGTLNLRLDQAAARYYDGFVNVPIAIERGTLSLVLGDRSFSTRLEGRLAGDVPRGLEALAPLQTLIDARGSIDAQGRLMSTTPNVNVAGAVALDKSAAGYLFDKPVLNGNLQGVTLWKR